MSAIWDKASQRLQRAWTPPTLQSPVADLPYSEAAEATASMIEEWKMEQPSIPDLELDLPKPKIKPWYHGCIGGVPIRTLLRRMWTSTRDGIRTNRYGLPARLYVTLWLSLLFYCFGMLAVGIPEGLEMISDKQKNDLHPDYRGPACGPYEKGRFYRVVARQLAVSLPVLCTLTIFFFPAIVNP
ncbi:hypothetical protein E8E12_007126 [Didymella heteroderae]|uniref:Uncharacterized protein n=1 Tax=Didymella heteroderae TaxID=1769908 RepID=A0A9P4WMR4_9PLEO|nr:hypothetical protein E8E12_007126 [Didymella heteroderae]